MDQPPDRPSRSTAGSARLHEAAGAVVPGGVSHNVRAADPHPLYAERSAGQHLVDVDGNRYVDWWNDHGASLLGHAHPAVVEAVQERAADGLHLGTPNEPSLDLARRALGYLPGADRLRFCVTGTEATMYAVRLARAHTGRPRVLKLEGGWHGGNTDLAHAVHPPFDAPTTHGLPPGAAEHCHAVPPGDADAVQEVLERYPDEVAAAVVDPRQVGDADAGVLHALVAACEDEGALLVLDEVVTGFRVAPGSYAARAGLAPDLYALGKILGGGMPAGAVAGRAELFAPATPDAGPDERVLAGGGTYSADPLTAAAGLATLDVVEAEPVYEHTERLGERARDGLTAAFEDLDVAGTVGGFSSLLQPAFHVGSSADGGAEGAGDAADRPDPDALAAFHRGLRERGHFFNQGTAGNVSFAHTEADVDGLVEAARAVLAELRDDGVV